MLHQIVAACSWNFRSIFNRLSNALVVVVGFFSVIVVLSTVLAVRDGVLQSQTRPGTDAITVVSSSAGPLDAQAYDVVMQAPEVVRDTNGPVASGTKWGVNLLRDWRPGSVGIAVVMGVDSKHIGVLPNFRIVSGRMFRPGLNELLIGKGALRLYPEFVPGRTMHWHHRIWKIVGVFATGSNVQDSLFLTDLRQAQDAIGKGNGYDQIMARLISPAAFDPFKKNLEKRPGLTFTVRRLSEKDSDMGAQYQLVLTLVAAVISLLMAVGAIFAALNIMYANVASRAGELAVLRALGFSRGPVLVAILAEALLLALVGGGLGVLTAALCFNGFESSAIMGQWQVTFEFAITPSSVAVVAILTLGMGFAGGLFPAIRAARSPIAEALREE